MRNGWIVLYTCFDVIFRVECSASVTYRFRSRSKMLKTLQGGYQLLYNTMLSLIVIRLRKWQTHALLPLVEMIKRLLRHLCDHFFYLWKIFATVAHKHDYSHVLTIRQLYYSHIIHRSNATFFCTVTST